MTHSPLSATFVNSTDQLFRFVHHTEICPASLTHLRSTLLPPDIGYTPKQMLIRSQSDVVHDQTP
ncbi:uncharacterized protein CLUP02_09124 [Colletotrichum lupini]|uniref:Uncharacterized protein n=1 Tax=Colletotrichum lupini TaxID=145971 RepID=A0A9Q8SU63_9PEZI|nr:uncharacterized protein CLUP02_09124 [Colletotrichum lupini]UQC83629.1 hypothetical protein CLUP02_09124 [Colletotrichum lupini]